MKNYELGKRCASLHSTAYILGTENEKSGQNVERRSGRENVDKFISHTIHDDIYFDLNFRCEKFSIADT